MSETQLSTVYDPKAVEDKWYAFWEKQGYFYADADGKPHDAHPQTGDVYCITIPPPNVTGSLHMGHALQHAVHDCLIRWNRMRGKLTLCVPGTDHASIAVHTKIEQQLAQEGTSRRALGREKFLERAWAWKEHYGGVILQQLRLLGCSYDWRRTRFTMDDHYYRAVQSVFVEWFKKGWAYRGYRICNWCPRCQTSLSDLEAPMGDAPGQLYHIRYPLAAPRASAGDDGIVVATTRPETMLGDTAVAVNPQDERYRHLIGKMVILPLMERAIPIIADDYVDPSFGTGAVKITPAHDPNDFEVGQRHNLPQVLVIGKDAHMTAEAKQYAGMERYECREAVVRDLRAQGYLVKVEDYPDAKVPRCARCDTVLEPLPLEQWFVHMKPMAARAIEAIESGKVRYVPERYTAIALEWLRHIRDWNISRQLWWGQRIPAWRCADCTQWTVQLETPTTCAHCGSAKIEQDPDVFDTWFSSGIWPQTVLGHPDDTPDLKTFFPTSLLITDRQILHLWVARMIMSSLDFLNEIPFHDVYVHPTILNWEGKRMSKSLGTGVDPLELIQEYGADATRFGLLYMCSITQDVRFTEERIEMARNFCNKIWNAARFALMHLETFQPVDQLPCQPADLPLAERWILSRYTRAIQSVTDALTSYNFDVAARALYDFIWGELCDWYLEMAKPALRSNDATTQQRTQQVLWTVLEGTLRLLHPFMPFLSEEIWQRLPKAGVVHPRQPDAGGAGGSASASSLMVQPYPTPPMGWIDADAEMEMNLFMDTVRAVRNLRAEADVQTGKPVNITLLCHSDAARRLLESLSGYFSSLDTRATLTFQSDGEKPHHALSAVVGAVEVFLPLSGEELTKEIERLTKECDRLRNDIARKDKQLSNEHFLQRAPAAVVAKERARRSELAETLKKVEERLKMLSE
ncbi:MAG: valine--tRNA ligase [Abditibacteriales bacterium]|nr:valine--tRNA ligase [Abditibacteriales bacterium]MDW8364293.1 valine--tRNA ligase [Abditibacteriales bacterium]